MVKYAHSLTSARKIKESSDFLCEGFHLVEEAIVSQQKIRFIFSTSRILKSKEGLRLFEQARREKIKWFLVTDQIVIYLSSTVTPQEIIAVVKKPEWQWPLKPLSSILGLYQIQDAGNLGTILRSSEALGGQGVLLTSSSCDPFNSKVVRASMGSIFRVPIMSNGSWESYHEWFVQNKLMTVALDAHASKSLFQLKTDIPIAFWLGSEGSGLPEELMHKCQERVFIPMAKPVESLNIAVAASLALFFINLQNGYTDFSKEILV
jgi:TrmH family RNA methyltransferase